MPSIPWFVRQDAERNVDRLVANEALVADFDPDRIEEDEDSRCRLAVNPAHQPASARRVTATTEEGKPVQGPASLAAEPDSTLDERFTGYRCSIWRKPYRFIWGNLLVSGGDKQWRRDASLLQRRLKAVQLGRAEIELRTVVGEERGVAAALLLGQDIGPRQQTLVRLDRARLGQKFGRA